MITVRLSDGHSRQNRGKELTTFGAVHSRFFAVRDHSDYGCIVTENERFSFDLAHLTKKLEVLKVGAGVCPDAPVLFAYRRASTTRLPFQGCCDTLRRRTSALRRYPTRLQKYILFPKRQNYLPLFFKKTTKTSRTRATLANVLSQ